MFKVETKTELPGFGDIVAQVEKDGEPVIFESYTEAAEAVETAHLMGANFSHVRIVPSVAAHPDQPWVFAPGDAFRGCHKDQVISKFCGFLAFAIGPEEWRGVGSRERFNIALMAETASFSLASASEDAIDYARALIAEGRSALDCAEGGE
jgi:hypothetical protein